MKHKTIEPRTAVREERRQANEALGRSFCKTLAELITNSDSSAKRRYQLPHSSGLVNLMLQVPKGTQLDTAALKEKLRGVSRTRRITVDVVTSKGHGRQAREIVVIDEAQGMSATALETALKDIAGDRTLLAGGAVGRNLFGRGLSDVMRAHEGSEVQTFDGTQLSTAKGSWTPRWKIHLTLCEKPRRADFKKTLLVPSTTGTAVRFVGSRDRFTIPDPPYIVSRLANFYMLRLIASDPNVHLVLRQYRAGGKVLEDRITYDFPVGSVIESFSRTFEPGNGFDPLKVDFLLARSDQKLQGLGGDKDARENGLLIVDELDAVYELTFVDSDYEKAEFLQHIFGIVRVSGLRAVLEAHLNSPDFPTSPLRVDREGFNRDHEFSKALLTFLADELRPCYEKERKRLEQQEQGKLSDATRKRIDDALKHLNKYFQKITDLAGTGQGGTIDEAEPPSEAVCFFPKSTRLIVGRPRRGFLLVKDSIVADGCEVIASATEGFFVQPDSETIYRKTTPRWSPHPNFFCIPFLVTGSAVGQRGIITALVGCAGGETADATLRIEDVLEEPTIVLPENMEFRPQTSNGRPNRRNGLTLYVNPEAISAGHYIRFSILRRTGDVEMIDHLGDGVQQLQVKLNSKTHAVQGQGVFRVRVPWRGTAWNQRAVVEARVKVGSNRIVVQGHILLDQPEANEGGFFKEVKYGDVDGPRPSVYAAGVIKVNMHDPLNRVVFGAARTEQEAQRIFDRQVIENRAAQQRLATVLLEEASFRALEQLRSDNKLHMPKDGEVTEIHRQVDSYKFSSAVDVYRALVR